MSEGSKKIFPVHFSPIYWQLNVERERERKITQDQNPKILLVLLNKMNRKDISKHVRNTLHLGHLVGRGNIGVATLYNI